VTVWLLVGAAASDWCLVPHVLLAAPGGVIGDGMLYRDVWKIGALFQARTELKIKS
jgi:hypothetical protein